VTFCPIKIVTFCPVTFCPYTNNCNDITEILLKVALNTITPTWREGHTGKSRKNLNFNVRIQYISNVVLITWKTPIVLTTDSLTAGVQVISDVAKKWLDIEIKASFGHLSYQFIAQEEISPGNFSDWLVNFSPSCERLK
jgi:hypothetical protein